MSLALDTYLDITYDAMPPVVADEASKELEATLGSPDIDWRIFQWLARDLVPDPSFVLG